MSLEAAYEFLASVELLSLATSSKDGLPHCAPSFFAVDGRSVFFTTSDQTTTGKNLLSNPRAAFGEGDAPDPGQTWDDAKGIQIVGNVVHLDGAEADAAAAALMAKYSHLGEAIKQSHLFRLDPTRVKYLHNAPDGDEAFETLGVNWVIEEF
ncbi:MAG: pyridoxamine 5'-phosphate oxidase family protein [Ilumatobacteraceae bacterium]|jgi:uncharacterized protein YhbP (UPF0306 family)